MPRVVIPTHDCLFDIFIEPTYLLEYDLCSSGNEDSLSEMYCAWIALLRDSPLSDSSKRPVRVVKQFVNELLTIPFTLVAKKYDHLFDVIYSSPTLYGAGSITGEYCPEMTETPIFFEYIRFRKTGDPKLFQWILSFLKFCKKFEYHDDSLHDATLRGWRASEDRLSRLVLNRRVCEHLGVIVDKFVFAYEAKRFVPNFKHGPGTVANTQRGPVNKCMGSFRDPRLMRFFSMERIPIGAIPNLNVEFVPGLDDEAEWLEAPKSFKIMRSICREPVAHMYLQQGVLNNLLEALKYGPMTRFVDLEDQQKNRDAALIGSIDGSVDTIDLSSASDLVSIDLVKAIFPHRLLRHLLLTRTDIVRIKETGERIRVKKFAPMGSALCFPIQCIIYTAMVIYAHMKVQAGEDPKTLDDVIAGCRSDSYFEFWLDRTLSTKPAFERIGNEFASPRIFGDDIICDHRVTDCLIELLESCGFQVNRQKSFTGSQACRESCGIYCYNGFDVTPFYWTPWNMDSSIQHALVSYVAFANRAYQFGYFNVRASMIHIIRARSAIYFGERNADSVFWSDKPLDQIGFALHTERVLPTFKKNRWNKDLQRFETRGLVVKTKHIDNTNEGHERWRLHEWYRHKHGVKPVFYESDNAMVSLVFTALGVRSDSKIQSFPKPGVAWDSSIRLAWKPI